MTRVRHKQVISASAASGRVAGTDSAPRGPAARPPTQLGGGGPITLDNRFDLNVL